MTMTAINLRPSLALMDSLRTFMFSRQADLVKRIGELSTQSHQQIVEAMFKCVGLQDKNIKQVKLWPKTGDFELCLDRPLMGRAQPTGKEAPAGVVLQLGFNPITEKRESVKGRISKEGIHFSQGISSYVISAINHLEGANGVLAKGVTMMPKFISRRIFKNAGFEYDSKDGSLSGPVQVTGVAFKGDRMLQSFSLFGGGDKKPADKESSINATAKAWKEGEPLPFAVDYKAVLKARYQKAMAAGC